MRVDAAYKGRVVYIAALPISISIKQKENKMNGPRIEYGFCPNKCCITIMGDTGVIILPVEKIQEIAAVIATHQNSINEPHININLN